MQRVLDIDLDFFLSDVAYYMDSEGERLVAADGYEAWSVPDAMDFLRSECLLDGRRRPGYIVEHHGEMFFRWRDGIDAGLLVPPFHVTHVDAHADLGTGDAGWVPLMTEVLHLRPEDRARAPSTANAVADGNYLSFALACRWISALEFVHNEAWCGDLNILHMKDFELEADAIQLKAVSRDEYERIAYSFTELPAPCFLEPEVPFHCVGHSAFRAEAPYDLVCLCRSPGFTTVECDPIFDAIANALIDPLT
jgi:hypothetical protein